MTTNRYKKRRFKIAIIFGTRPEAIKMAPVILELKRFPKIFEVVVVATGQHQQLLNQSLLPFKLKPDYDLKIMEDSQTLFAISTKILSGLEEILKLEKPDLVLVQGDTPTTFNAAIAAFYAMIPIGHIEAGLRTYQKYDPFPEEMNRQMIDNISDLFFVHTEFAKRNLIKEGRDKKNIWVTGNTVIDSLNILNKVDVSTNNFLTKFNFDDQRIVLLTCHRRESWGLRMEEIFKGIRRAVEEFSDVVIVFPVHPNPVVRGAAHKVLAKHPRIHLLKSLGYLDIVSIMKRCYLVLTDSGGLQEEAPFFNKPLLVLRERTERVEGLRAGTLKIAGISQKNVYDNFKRLLVDKKLYKKMSRAKNPYGDGLASKRITKAIMEHFNL